MGMLLMEALLTSECVTQLGAGQGIRKNSEDGSINLDSLTKGFVKARNFSGREFTDNPPYLGVYFVRGYIHASSHICEAFNSFGYINSQTALA